MKKHLSLPILSILCGVFAFLLRGLQNRSGFEPETGLPIPGSPFSLLLPGVLLLTAILAAALCFRLPRDPENAPAVFSLSFSSRNTTATMLAIAGIFLWCLSGAAAWIPLLTNGGELYISTAAGLLYPVSAAMQRVTMILSALLMVSAVCLFPAAAASRARQPRQLNGNVLLVPVVYLIFRLILSYREMSINASQQAYYVELLALVLLTLSLFSLSSFAFQCGNTRRFALCSSMAAVLCAAALADATSLSDRLFYIGGCAVTLGFLFLRLSAPEPTDT